MRLCVVFACVSALKHEDIVKAQWDSESVGQKVMLDMYADW